MATRTCRNMNPEPPSAPRRQLKTDAPPHTDAPWISAGRSPGSQAVRGRTRIPPSQAAQGIRGSNACCQPSGRKREQRLRGMFFLHTVAGAAKAWVVRPHLVPVSLAKASTCRNEAPRRNLPRAHSDFTVAHTIRFCTRKRKRKTTAKVYDRSCYPRKRAWVDFPWREYACATSASSYCF